MAQTKVCKKCQKRKKINAFYLWRRNEKYGPYRTARCKVCTLEGQRKANQTWQKSPRGKEIHQAHARAHYHRKKARLAHQPIPEQYRLTR